MFEGLPQSSWSFLAINAVFITILLSVIISEILKAYLEFKRELHRILLSFKELAKEGVREAYEEEAKLLLTRIECLRSSKKYQAVIEQMGKEITKTMEKIMKDLEEIAKKSKESNRLAAGGIVAMIGVVMLNYILLLWYYQRIPLLKQYFEPFTTALTVFLAIFIALIALTLNDNLIKKTEEMKKINRQAKKNLKEIKKQEGAAS